MSNHSSPRLANAILTAAAVVATACSSNVATPTSPSLGADVTARNFLVGDTTTATPEAGKLKVCKTGNRAGTFAVVGATSTSMDVQIGQCIVVAENHLTEPLNISVNETSPGLASVSATSIGGGTVSFSNGGTLSINEFHGFTITFVNHVETTGTQGCSPGYWKNHLASWPAPYTTASSFDTAFGIGTNWFAVSVSLADALDQNGGGVSALGRQAAAALLNAAGGFYPLTTAQVIARVQATYNGTYTVDETKDYFEALNNLTCPLN
jgi:hypothetical protein